MGTKLFFGARVAAIWDSATGNAVTLSPLASERTNYKQVPLMVQTNTQRENGSRYTLSVATFDADNLKTMRDWARNGTALKALIVGTNAIIYWAEAVPVIWEGVIKLNVRDGMALWALAFNYEGESDSDIYECANLTEQLNPWGVIDGELPRGATLAGTAFDGSFAGSVFTVLGNDGAPQDSGAYYRIEFPAANIQATWTVGFGAATYAYSAGTIKAQVIQRNYAGTALQTSTVNVSANNSRNTVSFTTVAGVYYLDLYIFDVTGLPDGQSFTVNNPALRLGTQTSFVQF